MARMITSLMCLLLGVTYVIGGRLGIQGKKFMKDGQHVFLSGANTAWVAYGYDFGNNQYQYRRNQYLQKMDMVQKAGGNSMRTWIHIHGATSPAFDSNWMVTGLDEQNSFIADFTKYLDDAEQRGILIFPCLWSGALIQEKPEALQALITQPDHLQSYLDKALTPWVNAVKDHPAMGGWDIINEFEGFVIPGENNADPCFDTTILGNSGAGWAGRKYHMQDILRFINLQADAIYKADPQALVTAGSWSQKSQTDRFGAFNYYKDECLRKAGGKADGIMNFYSTHSYSWQGKWATEAVFNNHKFSDYEWDRPVVVAEFMERQAAGMTDVQLFHYVYDNGYQGAWVWSDDDVHKQSEGITALNGAHGGGGVVNFSL